MRFFDSIYNSKFVTSDNIALKYIGKDTYFRNIYLFIKRVSEYIIIKSTKVIRNNLITYLRGITLK